jgi:hypothetical protein
MSCLEELLPIGVPGGGACIPRGISLQVLFNKHLSLRLQNSIRTASRLAEPRELLQAKGFTKPHFDVRSTNSPLLVWMKQVGRSWDGFGKVSDAVPARLDEIMNIVGNMLMEEASINGRNLLLLPVKIIERRIPVFIVYMVSLKERSG